MAKGPHTGWVIGVLVGVGVLAAPASALAKGWVYVESNNARAGKNAVLATPYGNNGRLNRSKTRSFPTRGTGAALIRDKGVGTLAGDQEVILSPNRRRLFAVNQGSNTIAVFNVNRRTGTLRHVKGSPFRSRGKAPISVGFNGDHLVVVNHGTIAPFEPAPDADYGDPNFTSFSVSSRGRLRKIDSVPAEAGASQAAIAPNGRNVFSTSFYKFLPFFDPPNETIQSLTLSRSGRLSEAPGSPLGFPKSMTANRPPPPSFLPPGIENLAFGVATHPTAPIAYILGTVNSRVAIYRYGRSGKMTFVGQEDNDNNGKALGACWFAITSDGRYMYTANTVTQDISLLRISPNGRNLTFVDTFKLPSTGTVFNLAIDANDRYLYALGGYDDPDGPRPQGMQPDGSFKPAPLDANYLEAYRIGGNGRLKSIQTMKLPVGPPTLPYGLAALERAG